MTSQVICGICDKKILDKLNLLGYEVILVQPNSNIDPATKNHADLSVIKLSDNEVIVEKTQTKLINYLKNEKHSVTITKSSLNKSYPKDTILNFLMIGNFIIGNIKNADESLTKKIKEKSLTPINVKQGYARCSSIAVNENALITDDKSIAKAATKHGIDTLLIQKGDVKLKGHNYGFIGGASCKLNDKILFFGDITKHKDYDLIASFFKKHKVKFDYISDLHLTDIGSAIVINNN